MKPIKKDRTITKNIINRNISIDCSARHAINESDQESYNFNDLKIYIAQAKRFLLEEKNFKKGDRVVLCTTIWPEFIIWFFAVAELGGIFLVLDSPTRVSFGIFGYRLEVYGRVDHFIHPNNEIYRSLIKKLKMEKISIPDRSYVLKIYSKEIDRLILAENSDPILASLSSGSSDKHRIVTHTHEFFYKLAKRNIRILNLKENDRCSHVRNLHHGSAAGVYFLPSIIACNFHMFQKFIPETANEYVNELHDYKIDRLLVYSAYDLRIIIEELKKQKSKEKLIIQILFEPRAEDIEFLCGERNCEVISIFGCVETSGPLFLSRFNDTNYKNINFKNFGQPLDDFYKLRLKNQMLSVTMYNGVIANTGDEFEIINDEWHHRGRKTSNKFRGSPLYVPLVARMIEDFGKELYQNYVFQKNFDLVIDHERQKIYLRSDYEIDIIKLNAVLEKIFETNSFEINLAIVDSREKYISGTSFDTEYFQSVCRLRLNSKIF